MNKYYVIKMITGEIIISEAEIVGKFYRLTHPLIFEEIEEEDNILFATRPYLPFCESNEFLVSDDKIIMCGILDEEHIKIYGTSLAQHHISQIQNATQKDLTGNITEDYHKLLDSIEEMKKIGQEYSDKFNIDLPDFSLMEEKLASVKPEMH